MVEKEYIDLEETVTALKLNSQKYFSSFHKGYVQAIEDLADIPAAKVSPVVRCKDCVLHGNCGLEDMFALAMINAENAFCCVGERKENGNDT